MRFFGFILALVTAVFPIPESRADNCQFSFRCQGNVCERVLPASCIATIPIANVVVNAPLPSANNIGTTSTNAAFANSDQSTSNSTSPTTALIGAGCAENGSCFGDISNINGMPKTNHVNGYFRKDGTYVRGHYRSSGRR